jgi:protein-L-isoaspartate(D-aspartate) O-methyltransferase
MADLTGSRDGIGMTSARTRGRMVERLREQGVRDAMVLAAMGAVPRHLFVEQALESRAYDDDALPIGYGQTISSPYVVARMSELARDGQALERVLEIGCGCGYQAAVLARLSREVVTLERIAALVGKARGRLRELRVTNVRPKHGDGLPGFREGAPYDAIVVAAAFAEVPQSLLLQLKQGGRLVMPLGTGDKQSLLRVRCEGERFIEEYFEAVRFVPLLAGVA